MGSENALVADLLADRSILDSDTDETRTLELPESWQPLVLYGPSGSGKSHFSLRIAERWESDLTVAVTTAADISRLFQPSQMPAFDNEAAKFRSVELLIIDDIDHLSDLASDWLIGLLDHRNLLALATVVTVKSLASLRGLPLRLASRLLAGLPIRCALPEAATRRTIIRDAMSRVPNQTSLTNTNQDSLPAIETLVRESAGLSVAAIWNLVQSTFSATDTSSCNSTNQNADFPEQCIAAVARRFGVRVSDVKGSSRRKNTVMARSIAMYLIREFTSLSLVQIGQFFQHRDHSTVRHACQKIKKVLLSDPQVFDAVSSICTSMNIETPVGSSRDKHCA